MDAKIKVSKTKLKKDMIKGTRRNHYTTVRMPSCKVCRGASSGYHFGVITCEACKAFFRRAIQFQSYSANICQHENRCSDIPANITACIACRLKRCLQLGMSKEGVRKGRYSSELRVKAILETRLEESESESITNVSQSIGSLSLAQLTKQCNINSDLASSNKSFYVHPSYRELKSDTHIARFKDIPSTPVYRGSETGTADFNDIPSGHIQLMGAETGIFDYSDNFNYMSEGTMSHVVGNTNIFEHTAGFNDIPGNNIGNLDCMTGSRKHIVGFNNITGDNIGEMGGVTGTREYAFNGMPWDSLLHASGETDMVENAEGFSYISRNDIRQVDGETGAVQHTKDSSNTTAEHIDGQTNTSYLQNNAHVYVVSNDYSNKTFDVKALLCFDNTTRELSSNATTYGHQNNEQHCDSEKANDGTLSLYSNTEQWPNSTFNTGVYPQHFDQHMPDLVPTPDSNQHVTAVNVYGKRGWFHHVNESIQTQYNHEITTVSRDISKIDTPQTSAEAAEGENVQVMDGVLRKLIQAQGMLFPTFQVTEDIIREQTRTAHEHNTWKTDYLFMSEPTNIVSNDVFKRVMSDFNVELDDRLVLFKNYAKSMEKNLVLYIYSSKYIPGFDRLEQDDVTKLLKASYVDFWLFTNCVAYDTVTEVSAGTDGVMNAHTEVLSTFFTLEYIDHVFSFSETLNKMNFTLEEISVIRAILLTFTDRCSLSHPDKVEHLQHLFVQCLRTHLSKTTANPSERFCKIMDRIVAVRSITHLSAGVNEQLWKDWGLIMKDFQLWSEMMAVS